MAKDGTIKINAELDSSKAQAAMSKFSGFAKAGLAGVAVAAGTVGTAMTAVAGYAIKVGSDFEAGMSKVSAISGATGEDLDALSEKAKEMGAKTKFSATEAASAFEYMAMAGWKTEDMLNGVEGVMNLAAASGEDLASVSDIVTDAITAFGLSASDSAHFADVLAKASSSANTNVGMMGETFKYAAPVAGALKYSIEDTATAIGLMANAGIKGGQAGTALRAMLARLVDPPTEAANALSDLGISLTNTDGSMKPLIETIRDLRSSFSGLDESQRASYASSIAGQEAMSGLLAIVGASDSDFNNLVASINSADGAAQSMADTMQDNLQGSMTILGSTIEGFGIKIYERMQEPLRKAADSGIECVNRISSAFDSGGIKGAVKEAGKLFDELTDEIADTNDEAHAVITPLKNIAKAAMNLGKTVLPVAAKAFSIIVKNADKLVPIIVAGYTAFKVYGVVTQLAAIKTALLTKAQAALNAVMAMNPIALAAIAVGALVVGLGTYALMAGDATLKTYEFTDAEKENLKACKEHTQALNEQRTAREESISSIDREYSGYQKLLEELQSITDANGNVKVGYEERAKVITGELSNALGVEITMLDGQVQKYGEVVNAIKEVIVQKKAEALLSSMQDDMAKAYENSEKALNDYKNASKAATSASRELGWAEDALEEAQKKYDEAVATSPEYITKYANELDEAEARVASAKEAQAEARTEMENSKTALEELSGELNNYNALQEAVASGETEKIESAIASLVTSYRSYTAEALEASEQTRNELYAQANSYVENLGMIQDGTVQVADEIYGQMADTTAKTIANFNQLPGGIAQGITDIGPQASAAMLAALEQADMDGKLGAEGKAAYDAFLSSLSAMPEGTRNAILSALQPMLSETAYAKVQLAVNGENAVTGFNAGIKSGTGQLNTTGKQLIDEVDEGTDSKNLKESGEKDGEEYASGVGSKKPEAKKEGQGLATNADSGSRSKSGYQPGSDFGAGFVSGINSWIGPASKAGANLANTAYESARRALDEHSPSRKTKKSGKNFDLGMAIGISDNEKYAIEAVENLSENALNALDTDAIYARMKELDVSGIMERVNFAIDDKQIRASERIITEVKAKMPESSRTTESNNNPLEIDYKRLGKEISKRPVIVVNALDGKETSRRLAVPMEQEMQNNARFRNMLKGEW